MDRRLIVVTELFEIPARCICALPVVPYALIEPTQGERLKPGDQLELRRPDGNAIRVKLAGLGRPSPSKGGLIIQLGASISRGEIPIGTEIWKF
jgi:hypothetical protein